MKGNYIKENRTKLNMTQSDLAEKLDVSVLKISRWEADEDEPNLDELNQLSVIFGEDINDIDENNSSANEPLESQKEEDYLDDAAIEESKLDTPIIEEKIKEEAPKRVLEICVRCRKKITEKSDLFAIGHSVYANGKSTVRVEYVCQKCKLASERKINVDEKVTRKSSYLIALTVHSLIWPFFHLAIFSSIAASLNSTGNTGGCIFFVLFAIIIGAYVGCVILQNNFISSIFFDGVDILREAEKKYPIKPFDYKNRARNRTMGRLAGDAFLITFLASLLVGIFTSVFVYPYALIKNIKNF